MPGIGADTVDMSYPPSSYLSPTALEGALELARVLRDAAEEIRILTVGTAPAAGAGGGRVGDAAMATREWIGPHRETFERLHANELASAQTTRTRLEDEADDWARFWAQATDARQQRQYEEALFDHQRAMDHYHRAYDDWNEAISNDPSTALHLLAPTRPTAPSPPAPVPVPTAASDYRPTL